MPPKGYRGLTVRNDVIELLVRARTLFHKSQIQILLEALSEYISKHHEYGSALLAGNVTDPVAVAWSAGIFEGIGNAYRHPSPEMKIAVEITSTDKHLLSHLKDLWGGSLYKENVEAKSERHMEEIWIWSLRSEKAKRYLEAVLPYLKGRKAETSKELLPEMIDAQHPEVRPEENVRDISRSP